MKKPSVYPVILAGGSGTRFWPLSRESYPKQLLRFAGQETMIQRTVNLARRIVGSERVTIVTHELQADAIRMQLNRFTAMPNLLLEPQAKNTAPAIGLAASRIFQKDKEAILMVMPADHVIKKMGSFTKAVREACRVAEKGYLMTFGVRPTHPETGYGYIKAGARCEMPDVSGKIKVYEVEKFVEKPDQAKAKQYLREGRYYWNSGIFVFQAAAILKAIQRHLPALAKGLREVEKVRGTQRERDAVRRIYHRLPSVSIDYGVMERVSRKSLAVMPVSIGWSDVGSWSALDAILPRDRDGNILRGDVIPIGCENSILYADLRPVAVIGAKDMVVVDTPDATLVCPKDRTQEVRKVVEILKKKQAEEHLAPRTVERPWGSFTVLENGKGYKIKRIVVNPGARLSLQLHHHRSEHWVVVAGKARVTRGKKVFDLKANESTYIPMNTKHRIENPGRELLQIIEVQNGDYIDEDDIVRFQDDYGRGVK